MQDQSTLSPAEQDAQAESAILCLLLGGDAQWPWSTEEIAREMGNQAVTMDALRRLHAAGLVHRLDGFIWPTRAALRADEIRL